VDKNGERSINVRENSYSRAKCRSQILRNINPLPFDLCQWIDLISTEAIVAEEVVQEISKDNSYPSEAVATMRHALE
jgi:hypothetical protein